MNDSLETVELVMALEESLGWEIGDGEALAVPKASERLFREILCKPYQAKWTAPDASFGWPAEVTILGRQGVKVLFNAGFPDAFGVGCTSSTKIIEHARMYPSLGRALYGFPHHACEI